MRMAPIRPRRALTRVELLVVCVIVAVLAGLLLPSVESADRVSGNSRTNALKQTVCAMIVYAGEQGGHWPVASVPGIDPLTGVDSPTAAATVTYRSLELLAVHSGLPNKLFGFRQSTLTGPTTKADASATSDAWGRGKIAFAYDWAAPVDSKPYRVVLASRSSEQFHGKVVAVCADTSVKVINAGGPVLAAGSGVTEGACRGAVFIDSQGTDATTGINADATAPDDIFSDKRDNRDGSDGGGSVADKASPRRAWVK